MIFQYIAITKFYCGNDIQYVALEPVQDHTPLSGGKRTAIDCLYCQNVQKKVPATSVPSEQAFSLAGYIVNQRRACLLPENVNMLVFFLAENHAFLYGLCNLLSYHDNINVVIIW